MEKFSSIVKNNDEILPSKNIIPIKLTKNIKNKLKITLDKKSTNKEKKESIMGKKETDKKEINQKETNKKENNKKENEVEIIDKSVESVNHLSVENEKSLIQNKEKDIKEKINHKRNNINVELRSSIVEEEVEAENESLIENKVVDEKKSLNMEITVNSMGMNESVDLNKVPSIKHIKNKKSKSKNSKKYE